MTPAATRTTPTASAETRAGEVVDMLVASGGSVVRRLVYAPPGRSDASARSLPRMESFSAQLRRTADPVWSAQHEHAFVRGIGDGTAGLDGFKRYVRHD